MKLRELLGNPLAEGGPYDLPGKDYHRPGDTPRKRSSGEHNPYPFSKEEDDDYFRDIFRKKRETAKKAEKDKGVSEGAASIMNIVTPALQHNGSLDGHISTLYHYIDKHNMENDPKWLQAEQMAKDYHFNWLKKHGYPTANNNPGLARKGEKIKHLALVQAVSKVFGQQDMAETATAETTNSSSIASVANPTIARSKKKVKSVSALDQNSVSLFGGPMENIQAPIIKRR